MTLYEINQQIEEAINKMFAEVDEETGEVSQENIDILESLQMARDEKIESIGCYIKNLKAETEALKAEEDRLKARRVAKEKRAERLKKYVTDTLGGENWDKSAKVAFAFRSSDQTIIDNIDIIPPIYLKTKTEISPDKTKIKAAIKDGATVPGAHIEAVKNIQVK